ncbi:MAG: hypothetical protein K8S21_12770 [Gemmatimonadetes bacterium]|nr:hypothetical protein [Gemmatimonadota bacterium]
MRRLAPLFLVACLLVAGCGSPTAVDREFVLGEPFWLAQGDRAVSTDGSTATRFVAVVSDSRCPPEAVCVWAGEVTVDIGVRVAGGEEVVTRLSGTTTPDGTRLQPMGRLVELLAVEGDRGAGGDPIKGYRAQLRVTPIR